eukprot:CAMPEP_0173397166 /NCGR_PEP_ID=MMETSP1356-20130122/37587_1 /TAXON_ID=77927 ORGANISM="Hemiselmis virescens, Strain PCC157" /NCGR_SAMPLE_ID=MMETSP1356 /ASSEMBLY_ACC=CAM_ASM_000847 /LENGTH=56 /DNA_ID=CAMNT_0014356361 /DNA_START=213 /DNA_END=380 /DNA_ORIENTATION=-
MPQMPLKYQYGLGTGSGPVPARISTLKQYIMLKLCPTAYQNLYSHALDHVKAVPFD